MGSNILKFEASNLINPKHRQTRLFIHGTKNQTKNRTDAYGRLETPQMKNKKIASSSLLSSVAPPSYRSCIEAKGSKASRDPLLSRHLIVKGRKFETRITSIARGQCGNSFQAFPWWVLRNFEGSFFFLYFWYNNNGSRWVGVCDVTRHCGQIRYCVK